MDPSHMDHSKMDLGGMGTPMEAAAMCSMNMLFNWQTSNLCIIFQWWHIQTTGGLLFSLIGIVGLTALYEAIRAGSRRYEKWSAKRAGEVPQIGAIAESTPLWLTGRNQDDVAKRAHVFKAVLYAVQSFYAFMLMLMFMTYNGWVMIAMGIGAFVGYLVFGTDTAATKESACH
ncbi:CTR2 long splice variant [Calycina marina]|uniref:Copper transport protein n=1 Tax=Calycina marina TaxID=1763456 RepID=A0A9P8CET3_9HELO|nr:CTR2 long splice variant [Calycina marina]